ncbi:RraA family protein [Bosea sp. (in: a-proteobacteria)]|jgi:RraA family protein|uniref:RraA family protein n=1 Tax=Bosea sp. (in: a-proteobacteria) TaxID=1871050 RepID=UPI003F6F8DAC
MIGFRILKRRRRVDSDLVERFRTLPVANVSDSMSRMTAGGASLRPLHRGGVMAGAALTVKTRPGDNLMIHKALDLAVPGDVVVVDGGGDLTNSLIGELMIAHARRRGIAGIVLHGAVRDSVWIRENDLPIYAAGISHRGPYKDGPGEINVPVSIQGMVIEPGDLVIGDDDGVLCVPFEHAEAIYAAAHKKQAAEEKKMQAINEGRDDRSWVDATLARLGCAIEA